MLRSVRWFFLCGCAVLNVAAALPSEFSVERSFSGSWELVWSPSENSRPVRIGDARPEFRLAGRLLGYPREINGQLRLEISNEYQESLATGSEGESLEVWSSGRRKDGELQFWMAKAQGVNNSTTSAARAPTTDLNPGQLGAWTSSRFEYNLSSLQLEEFATPIEVIAEVTDPSTGPGDQRPLILFIHGRHTTCYKGSYEGASWPCLDGWKPVPSYKGYRYIADVLASQGYIVISISANGISSQESSSYDSGASSRSQLIHHHLKLWAKWNTEGGDPWNNRFLGRLDMNKVVLVGHSRGGEGSHKAAIDAAPSDPYKIVGIVTYGATAFSRYVTPDVHSATILPTCDGDVSDLQGQAYIDVSRDIAYSEALRSAVIAVGCNHNFFNTEWTPGLAEGPALDDWWYELDPICGSENGSLRLSDSEQRAVGVTYTAALVKLAIHNDDTMLPFLDGTYIRPTAIGRAEVGTSAVGGAQHRYLYIPQSANGLTIGMQGNLCICWDSGGPLISKLPLCGNGKFYSPHWRPSCQAIELQWRRRVGATAQFKVIPLQSNCSDLDWIDVRIAVEPGQRAVSFNLKVFDHGGRSAKMASELNTVSVWPGGSQDNFVHAQTLRFSLASVRSLVDTSNIKAIVLFTLSTAGRVWILDVVASKGKVATPTQLNLPKLSFESVEAFETDGFQRYTMNIISDRPLQSPGSIWITDVRSEESYEMDLIPSSSTVVGQVSMDVTGDDEYTNFYIYKKFQMEALKGIVISSNTGILAVQEDEPIPVISVSLPDVVAIEGECLQWTLTLSAPPATMMSSIEFVIINPMTGVTELTTADVDEAWLKSLGRTWFGTLPLSDLNAKIPVYFNLGSTTATLSVPLINDGLAEDTEYIALSLVSYFGYLGPVPELKLTGSVLAHS